MCRKESYGPRARKRRDPLPALFADLEQLMQLHGWHTNPHLTLDQLAKRLLTNRHYLSHAIYRQTGEYYRTYLLRCRVREAQQLMLEEPGLRTAQVAFRSGYKTVEHFCRDFVWATGREPAVWREENLS